jgi:formylglycine-generating enzyme required for sulfatase activity
MDMEGQHRCRASQTALVGAVSHDMAGNAWEWTSSLYQDYPYQAGDGREDAASSRARVVRGGSWDYDQNDARSAYRFVYNPRWVTSHVGFRCGLSSMPSAP